MISDTPFLFFRQRENGATVFRVTPGEHGGRLEMDQIATANSRTGDIRPHGDAALSDQERTEIADWLAEQTAKSSERQSREVEQLCEDMNRMAHFLQGKADPEVYEPHFDRILMSMYDLRQVLIRRMGERSTR